MKKLLILAVLSTLGVGAQAQQRPENNRDTQRPSPEEMHRRAKEHLDLSDEQFEQWVELHTEFRPKIDAPSAQHHDELVELDQRVREILTDEQYELFSAHRAKERSRNR